MQYCEPFFGAGCLFFALRPNRALLGDANPHLMSFYRALKATPDAIARALSTHRTHGSKRHYYAERTKYNALREGAAQAARFLYLNKACFNGIFRVNREGAFNVPYGYRPKPELPTRTRLREARATLLRARLVSGPFETTLGLLKPGSFVYFDPPYPALNKTAYFAHYTRDRFTDTDQARLARAWRQLATSGCYLLMTNADTPLIRRLYHGFPTRAIPVVRYVRASSTKHRVRELLISNYATT